MRYRLSALVLLVAAAPALHGGPALAGGAEEFFLGRPPSVGVVQGGAFGVGGSDYLGETQGRPSSAPRAARHARRIAHVGRVRPREEPAMVARPYFRP